MRFSILFFTVLLFSCGEQLTDTNERNSFTEEPAVLDDVDNDELEELESEFEFNAENYEAAMEKYMAAANMPDSYVFENENGVLPMPSSAFLELKMKGEVYTFFEGGDGFSNNECYAYLAMSTDSLDSKTIIAEDTIFYMQKWRQHFKYGITYEEDYFETGGGGLLKVRSADKQLFLKAIRPVIEFPVDDEGNFENTWNSDSTNYSPVDGGAGCYYEIQRDSSTNFLSLTWYCGC